MSKATKVGGAEELGWQKIITFMDKGTLNRAQAFSKLHNIVMHQLINSAVKVFIIQVVKQHRIRQYKIISCTI